MNVLIVLQPMLMILMLVAIGYLITRRNMLNENTSRQISAIIVNVCNPAVILSSIYREGITATRMQMLGGLLFLVLLYALLCVLGIFLPRWIAAKEYDRRFYCMMAVYTNTGFMGIPVAQAILPPNAMIYVIITLIVFNLYFYTHGIRTLSGKSGTLNLRRMINPGTVCSVLALILFWFRIRLPGVVLGTIQYTGNATVFLSMALLGASLATTSLRSVLKDRSIWLFVVLRMIAFPILMVLVMRLLHLNRDLIQASCLMMALPAANLPLIQARKDGYDTGLLAQGILLTTVVSFVSITLIMGLMF